MFLLVPSLPSRIQMLDVMRALVPQIFHLQARWVATSVLMLRMHTNQLM
jgi:hypothetical protein